MIRVGERCLSIRDVRGTIMNGEELYHDADPYLRKVFRNPIMIDEINYFPKRENYQKKKKPEDDWNELKKKKILQDSRPKPGKSESDPPDPPPKKK